MKYLTVDNIRVLKITSKQRTDKENISSLYSEYLSDVHGYGRSIINLLAYDYNYSPPAPTNKTVQDDFIVKM